MTTTKQEDTMTDYQQKIAEQDEALKAFDAGVPSTLPPTNRFKVNVENHRWGGHAVHPRYSCPACVRTMQAQG